jgi:phage terminase large subunit-like protein
MGMTEIVKKYLGHPKLKKVGVVYNLKEFQVDEYTKCALDPNYFIENYVKIITLDAGLQGIQLYPFQKKAITTIYNERKIIIKAGRQVGKTTMVVGFILWYILFNEDKFVAILANKAKTAREILNRVKIAFEELPHWIQQGVKVWNKGDIELENNSRVLADSTASSAIRGFSISLLYLDEFAFVPNNIAEEF